jgi:DNA-binding LytR/AlgR family response regulator
MIDSTVRLIEREWAAQILQRAWLVADVYATTAMHYPHRPVLAFDAEGHLVRANAPGCAMLGLDPLAMAQRLLPIQVISMVATAVAAELSRLSSADMRARDLLVPMPAGGQPLSAVLVPVLRNGEVLGGVVIVTDGQARPPVPLLPVADLPARPQVSPLCRVVARGEDRQFVLVDVHSIAYAHADSRGVWLHTAERVLRSTHPSLQALVDALPATVFVQVNRADVVNLEWVVEIEQEFDQSYDLILRDPARTRIPVSRRRLSYLRELLRF